MTRELAEAAADAIFKDLREGRDNDFNREAQARCLHVKIYK